MALVRLLRGGQITLPADARRSLGLGEGDLLEAEVLDGEMRLRPVAAGERRRAWRRLIEIVDRDKWTGPGPRPGPEEEERWIADALAEDEPDRHA